MKIKNAQLALQILQLCLARSFDEETSRLLFGTNMGELKDSCFQFFSNEATVNFNMLFSPVKDQVFLAYEELLAYHNRAASVLKRKLQVMREKIESRSIH